MMGKMAQSELSWRCCSLSWHPRGPMCLLCAWRTPRYLKAFGSDAPSPRKPSWLPTPSAPDLHTLIRAFPQCPYCLLLLCRTTLQASQDSPTWPYCTKAQRVWDVCPASHSWEVAEPSTLRQIGAQCSACRQCSLVASEARRAGRLPLPLVWGLGQVTTLVTSSSRCLWTLSDHIPGSDTRTRLASQGRLPAYASPHPPTLLRCLCSLLQPGPDP